MGLCTWLPSINCKWCLIVLCTIQFFVGASMRSPRVPRNIKTLIPKQTPTWGTKQGNESSVKATWLGYIVVQWPSMVMLKSFALAATHATSLNYPLPLALRTVSVSFLTLYSRIAVLHPSGWGLLAILVRHSHQIQQHDLSCRPDARFRCAL